MKPIWKILIVTAVIVAVVAVVFVIPHYRAKAALSGYRRQLIAKGEKLSIASLTPQLSADAAKGGRELLSAAGAATFFTNPPPTMKWLAPGHALVSWKEVILPTEKRSNCWPEIAAVVKERPEITGQIAAALQSPDIGYNVQYQLGYSTPLPHLAPLKRASDWLTGSATLALHEGDKLAAWTNLVLESELFRKYASEPFMISQLVRAGIGHSGIAATWEALQYPGWSEEQLAQLQTNWDSANLLDAAVAALSMERAVQEMEFDRMRDSYKVYDGVRGTTYTGFDNLNQALTNPEEAVPGLLGSYPHYWMWKWYGSYDEELYLAQAMQAAVETLRNTWSREAFIPEYEDFRQRAADLERSHPGAKQRFVVARRISGITAGYMQRIAGAESERRMVVTALALERYRLRHGNYPERLEELAPEFLKKNAG